MINCAIGWKENTEQVVLLSWYVVNESHLSLSFQSPQITILSKKTRQNNNTARSDFLLNHSVSEEYSLTCVSLIQQRNFYI